MKLEIIRTPLAEKMSADSIGFSRADTDKAERLLKSAKSTITSSLIHLLLTRNGETSEVKVKWDKNEESTHLTIFHLFHIEDESKDLFEKIKSCVDELINNFPYYLHSCERFAFSKSISPLIVNNEVLNNLDPTIKSFIEKFLYEAISSKGSITLTGFFEDCHFDFNNLKVRLKETSDVGNDPNHVHEITGEVIDFNYEERQFTLLEEADQDITSDEKRVKVKFKFSEDEILNANQEAYFHRYCIEPRPIITVFYLKLSSGNYVKLDLMEEMKVGFNLHQHNLNA